MITEAYAGALQIHSSGGIAISSWRRTPSPRRVEIPRPSDHGMIDTSRYYGGAVFALEGYVHGASVAQAHEHLDALRGALALGRDPILLRWRREGMDYMERNTVRPATAVEAPLAGSRRLVRWSVQLVSEEAPSLSDALNVASYNLTAPDTLGLEFPLEFPLEFVSTGPSTTPRLLVTNAGNFPAAPQFVVHGPVDDPVVRSETTGEEIVTAGVSLDPDELLYLNVRDRSLRLDSATAPLRQDLLNAAATDWPVLVPGENDLRLSGANTDPGTTMLSASWRDARL